MEKKKYSAPVLSFVDVETSGLLLSQSSIEAGGHGSDGEHGEARNMNAGADEAAQPGVNLQQLDF